MTSLAFSCLLGAGIAFKPIRYHLGSGRELNRADVTNMYGLRIAEYSLSWHMLQNKY
jgi:hypothetical protein